MQVLNNIDNDNKSWVFGYQLEPEWRPPWGWVEGRERNNFFALGGGLLSTTLVGGGYMEGMWFFSLRGGSSEV